MHVEPVVLALRGLLVTLALAAPAACARHATPGGHSDQVMTSATSPEALASSYAPDTGTLREADIILQSSRSMQSQAIRIATRSRFSHMGLVHVEAGRTFVYEADGPVKLTPFDEWVARGEGKHFVVMRLKDADQRLTPEALGKMRRAALRFQGRPYDFAFGWSDDRIYCSELVWKVYKEALGIELGNLQRLGDFELSHPAVRQKLHERYGDRVPLDEPVISPAAIAGSSLLETILDE
jgi:hypothetical protein